MHEDLHLRLLSGNDSVTGDQLSHDTTSGFNTECEGADVDEDNVFSASLSRKDTTLNSSTIGNSLVRVDTL